MAETQSVCKHCQQERNRHHWKNAWCPHPDKDANMVTCIGPIWLRSTFEPVAEPASTGEPPEQCSLYWGTKEDPHICRLPLGHHGQHVCSDAMGNGKCGATLAAARPSEPSCDWPFAGCCTQKEACIQANRCLKNLPSAPQTSAELPAHLIAANPETALLEIEALRKQVASLTAAPQLVSGDAPTRNSEVLDSFVRYCQEHPEHRFWQALRNWSGYHFIMVADMGQWTPVNHQDTFNWEGKRHDDGK